MNYQGYIRFQEPLSEQEMIELARKELNRLRANPYRSPEMFKVITTEAQMYALIAMQFFARCNLVDVFNAVDIILYARERQGNRVVVKMRECRAPWLPSDYEYIRKMNVLTGAVYSQEVACNFRAALGIMSDDCYGHSYYGGGYEEFKFQFCAADPVQE